MIVKLQTEHHLEFLSLKCGCIGSSESTLIKMPHCWKSHFVAQMIVESGENKRELTYVNHNSRYSPPYFFRNGSNCHGSYSHQNTLKIEGEKKRVHKGR